MSPKYSLSREDGKKILTGALVALAGALLTYLAEVLTQINFGEWTPLVVSISSVLINAARKFLQGVK